MATNFVKASYNEIYDLSTQAGDVTTLKFHAPQGTLPQQYLKGFWTQFKKYRYYGSKIMMIPVATLPADPLQISYDAGEPTIDPRDMVNPILHKIYRGEALIDDTSARVASQLYSGVDQQLYNSGTVPTVGEDQYYATLQDPSWKKAHVQRGFRSRGIPLVRKLASNVQVGATHEFGNTIQQQSYDWDPMLDQQANAGEPGMAPNSSGAISGMTEPYWNATNFRRVPTDNNTGEIFTSGWDRLGWLDTSQKTFTTFNADTRDPDLTAVATENGIASLQMREILTRLPRIYTYIAILPPSYKQEMYFRLVISHEFGFKDFRSANMPWDGAQDIPVPVTPLIQPGSTVTTSKALSVESDTGEVKLTSVGVS